MINGFFANIFKTKPVENETIKGYKPLVGDLFGFLSTYIVSEDHKPEIDKKIQAFLSKPIDKQLDKLPSFYLFMEQFILNVNPNKNLTAEKLRKNVKAQFSPLVEQVPSFKMLFSGNEEQVFQLYVFFLKELSKKLGDILGASGNNLNELSTWLSELPEPQSPFSFVTIEKKPSGLKDWNEILIKISLALYDDIEKRFNGDFVKRFYQSAYENLSSSYKNLDNFHEILKLFPNKILDEDKVNLLSNQQIKLLLLEKIESLGNLSIELMTKNQALTEARSTIEEQNEELKSYSEDLETQVKKRTVELDDKNLELIRYNNQLEQYAFTISHHLRGPVARLLGLTSIFSIDGSDNQMNNQVIIPRITESARQLDDILKDLNRVIDIRKGVDVLGPVDINLILERLKSFFHNELQAVQAIFDIDLGEVASFRSNSLYIESIFYNLVSNAIRFRSPDKQLHIQIAASVSDDHVYFRVADNGLGLDLKTFGDKVFSLYQRFHLHIEGKGIGLHISKEQVEALGGYIEIESALNEGAVFIIRLPYLKTPLN